MKKQFNARISGEAFLAIKIAAKERGCSEAAVIEGWANKPKPQPFVVVSDVHPQPTDKKAIFSQLKAKAEAGTLGKEDLGRMLDDAVLDTQKGIFNLAVNDAFPQFPFKIQQGDDIWLVGQRGPKFYYQIEDGVGGGFISESEVGKLWEKRIK